MGLRTSITFWFSALSPWRRFGLLLAASVLILVGVLSFRAGVSRWISRRHFSSAEAKLVDELNKAEQRAEAAENSRIAVEKLLAERETEIVILSERATAAENAMWAAHNVVVTVKQKLDDVKQTQNDPGKPGPDARTLCAQLSAAGYPCR